MFLRLITVFSQASARNQTWLHFDSKLLTLRQKTGKGKENKTKYFTRIFNDIPEIRQIILTGQLRRSNFISLFDDSRKPVLKPRLPALSSSSSDY